MVLNGTTTGKKMADRDLVVTIPLPWIKQSTLSLPLSSFSGNGAVCPPLPTLWSLACHSLPWTAPLLVDKTVLDPCCWLWSSSCYASPPRRCLFGCCTYIWTSFVSDTRCSWSRCYTRNPLLERHCRALSSKSKKASLMCSWGRNGNAITSLRKEYTSPLRL